MNKYDYKYIILYNKNRFRLKFKLNNYKKYDKRTKITRKKITLKFICNQMNNENEVKLNHIYICVYLIGRRYYYKEFVTWGYKAESASDKKHINSSINSSLKATSNKNRKCNSCERGSLRIFSLGSSTNTPSTLHLQELRGRDGSHRGRWESDLQGKQLMLWEMCLLWNTSSDKDEEQRRRTPLW